MTPTLPETLRELARIRPDILEVQMGSGGDEPWVASYDIAGRPVWWGGDWPTWWSDGQARLEFALRAACKALDWHWEVSPGRARVSDWDRRWEDAQADDTTHAFCLAFIAYHKQLHALQAAAEAQARQEHPESKFDVAGTTL